MTTAPVFGAIESTTLAVVMTDAALDKLQCAIVARMAHDGMARAIDPVHTPRDGDCVFVMATGRRTSNVFQVGVAAAEAVAVSIRRAVRAAEGLGGAPSVTDSAAGRAARAGAATGRPALMADRPLHRDDRRPPRRLDREARSRGATPSGSSPPWGRSTRGISR